MWLWLHQCRVTGQEGHQAGACISADNARLLEDAVTGECTRCQHTCWVTDNTHALQAEEATKLEHAEEVMRRNAVELSQRAEVHPAGAQLFLNMGLVGPNPPPMPAAAQPMPTPEVRLDRGEDTRDNAVRCSLM